MELARIKENEKVEEENKKSSPVLDDLVTKNLILDFNRSNCYFEIKGSGTPWQSRHTKR